MPISQLMSTNLTAMFLFLYPALSSLHYQKTSDVFYEPDTPQRHNNVNMMRQSKHAESYPAGGSVASVAK